MRQVILDTETTGLQYEQGHRVIEIGCIELINRKFTGKRYHQYINPGRQVEEEALAVHGITNEFLQDKPVFSEIAQSFLEFVLNSELIIHNAPFDLGFIHHELNLTKQNYPPLTDSCRVIDSLILARQIHVGQRNSLDALCKRYNIDNSHREFHGALLDAHLLAQVYLAMTGGQGSLFGDLKNTEITQKEAIHSSTPTRSNRQLIIQNATADELSNHEMHLQKISEKGKCLWLTCYSTNETLSS